MKHFMCYSRNPSWKSCWPQLIFWNETCFLLDAFLPELLRCDLVKPPSECQLFYDWYFDLWDLGGLFPYLYHTWTFDQIGARPFITSLFHEHSYGHHAFSFHQPKLPLDQSLASAPQMIIPYHQSPKSVFFDCPKDFAKVLVTYLSTIIHLSAAVMWGAIKQGSLPHWDDRCAHSECH